MHWTEDNVRVGHVGGQAWEYRQRGQAGGSSVAGLGADRTGCDAGVSSRVREVDWSVRWKRQ